MFKFLDGVISMPHTLNLRDFYLIAGGIINHYRNLILMEAATEELAHRMLERANTPNVVQARVEQENLFRKNAIWNKLNENYAQNFPRCDMNYLKELMFGIYQIGLAPSYVQDKLDIEATDVFQFDEHRSEPGFIRIRLYSRFRNQVRFKCGLLTNWIIMMN